MNRRRVLRRRLVAVILVLLSIGMLTLYFRETDVGVVHRVQDGASSVVAPLQYGTARAIKPFRDAWNWTADLFHAKSENERLEHEVEQLRGAVADKLATEAENEELRGLVSIYDSPIFPDKAQLVPARVIARSTTVWYSTVTIDTGRDDGIEVYDAVVDGQGLIGRIESVKATTSQVQLITDQQSYVDAMVLPGAGAGRACRQRDRRPLTAVRGQGRGGQGGPVHRDARGWRAPCSRAASRSARSRACPNAGGRAVSGHHGAALRRPAQARPRFVVKR